MRRLVACICMLAVLMCALFSSCAPAVVTVGSVGVSDELYRFWLSCYKYAYLTSYRIEDTEAGWNQLTEDGRLYKDVALADIEREIESRLAAVSLMNKKGYTLPDTYRQAVAEYFNDWFSYYGEESTNRNEAFGKYGTNEAGAVQVGLYEAQYRYLYEMLFGENGEKLFSDSATYQAYRNRINAYYERTCRRVQIMFIVDKSDIARMDEKVASGELSEGGFLDCVARYGSTDEDMDYIDLSAYPDGIYLGSDMPAYATGLSAFPEVLELIFDADFELNSCRSVEANGGKYYVYRARLKDNGYLSADYKALLSTFASVCAASLYSDLLEAEADTMVKTDVYPDYDIALIPTNKDYNVLKILGY